MVPSWGSTIAITFRTPELNFPPLHVFHVFFRVYDRDGAGFITTGQLREIIAELDPRLTSEDLDGIIEEIDEDGSGTMDFDEFCQMMMS